MRPLNTALLNKVLLKNFLLNNFQLNKAVPFTACWVLALGLPGTILAQSGEQSAPRAGAANYERAASPTAPKHGEVASAELPESPGAAWAKAQVALSQQDSSSQAATPSSTETSTQTATQAGSSQTASTQSTSAQDQAQKPQRPVGTAAAEAPKVSGVTAAQPAGVAIAPAKQRRVRTIVLKVGAIVGAGAALGAVIALREATPSKPPGAH
jgi:hypothetical protein